MTTMTEARAALVAEIESLVGAEYPELMRVYGNQPADTTSAVEFLKVDVRLTNGQQTDLGVTPGQRKYGSLVFRVAVKEDAGDVRAIAILDFLDLNFQSRYVGGVLLKAPRPNGSVDQAGWCFHELFVPFQFDNRAG